MAEHRASTKSFDGRKYIEPRWLAGNSGFFLENIRTLLGWLFLTWLPCVWPPITTIVAYRTTARSISTTD